MAVFAMEFATIAQLHTLLAKRYLSRMEAKNVSIVHGYEQAHHWCKPKKSDTGRGLSGTLVFGSLYGVNGALQCQSSFER